MPSTVRNEVWRMSGATSTDYKGDKVSYTLSDATLSETQQTWKEVRADDYPELKNAALFCVTEARSRDDIETLATALEEIAGENA